jgi:Zn-dependent protease
MLELGVALAIPNFSNLWGLCLLLISSLIRVFCDSTHQSSPISINRTSTVYMFLTTLFIEPIFFLRVVLIVIISVTIHELAHGLAALSQGDDTPRTEGHLTPNPVVHMGWHAIVFLFITGVAWGQMPVNPEKFRYGRWSNILVAAAGPLANLALAGVAIVMMKKLVNPWDAGLVSFEFFYLAARINLVLFLFNLVPIPPLDGFQFFSELFPNLKPAQDSPFALFCLMLLLLLPTFGSGLETIADLIVQTSSGIKILAMH